MLKIITIDYYLSGSDVINTSLLDEQTLLDADIVIINPENFHQHWEHAKVLSDVGYLHSFQGSDQLRNLFLWRKTELETLLQHGKIILSFLAPVRGVNSEIHNSARFELMTNYDFLPYGKEIFLQSLTKGRGEEIKLFNPKHLFANYFHAFRDNKNIDIK